MSRFSIKTLEFDKVKEQAAQCAATELGKEKILAMPVSADYETVRRRLTETAEAKHLLDEAKRFPFGGLYNIAASVKRAKMGSVLEVDELQNIKTSAACFGALKVFLLTGSDQHPN
ncbi:MAG: endonuclease MutS2, partial [Succiniclasticum sp.]